MSAIGLDCSPLSKSKMRIWRAFREATIAFLKHTFAEPIDEVSIQTRVTTAREPARFIKWIGLARRKTRRALGGLESGSPDQRDPEWQLREMAGHQLMICMAPLALETGTWPGFAAPSRDDRFFESDFMFAMSLEEKVFGEGRPNRLLAATKRVKALLAKPDNRRAVEQIARRLLKRGHLTVAEIEDLLNRYTSRSH